MGRPILGVRVSVPKLSVLARQRLDRASDATAPRSVLVVGPAGSGKTSLLVQMAQASTMPVAWYQAQAGDTSLTSLLAHIRKAVRRAFPDVGPWLSVEEAAASLERIPGLLLCVDDLHVMRASAAERGLGRLLELLPPTVAVVAASRRPPTFDLSRPRVSGQLVQLGADELRFRVWEVEELFRDLYRQPLHPTAVAELCRRTGGWAAVLQLFHLATMTRSEAGLHLTLSSLGSSSRAVRQYLVRNVLDQLETATAEFLLRTSVLPSLTPSVCEELTADPASCQRLSVLEEHQIVWAHDDRPRHYRCHEILRGHLESLLVEQVGENGVRALHHRAGKLLERHEQPSGAVQAYVRAQAWDDVRRIASRGDGLEPGGAAEIDVLPRAMVEEDAWLLLATARRLLGRGDVDGAVRDFALVESAHPASAAVEFARVERMVVAPWAGTGPAQLVNWPAALRAATQRRPAALLAELAHLGAEADLARGLVSLVDGDVRGATRSLGRVVERRGTTTNAVIAARVGLLVASMLAGEGFDPEHVDELSAAAYEGGVEWLASLLASSTLDAWAGSSADELPRWVAALQGLLAMLRAAWDCGPAPSADACLVETFRSLGAPVLQAWAVALEAVLGARAGGTGAPGVEAERLARAVGCRGALALALHASAGVGAAAAEAAGAGVAAVELAGVLGLRLPERGRQRGAGVASPALRARCFGQFQLDVDGRRFDDSCLRPRVRQVLALLAVHAGEPVHRERLIEALWPGASPDVGARNVHVAVSTLRHAIEPGVGRGASSLLLRHGEAYVLAAPRCGVDVSAFSDAVSAARSAARRGAHEVEAEAWYVALELYTGDLLDDLGPTGWVLPLRDRCRLQAVEAAGRLAALETARGRPELARDLAQRGVELDRWSAPCWQQLMLAHERLGDDLGRAAARRRYQAVLDEACGTRDA